MGTPHIPSDPHTLPEIRQVLKVKLSLSLLNSSVPNYTLTHEKIHAREAWGTGAICMPTSGILAPR